MYEKILKLNVVFSFSPLHLIGPIWYKLWVEMLIISPWIMRNRNVSSTFFTLGTFFCLRCSHSINIAILFFFCCTNLVLAYGVDFFWSFSRKQIGLARLNRTHVWSSLLSQSVNHINGIPKPEYRIQSEYRVSIGASVVTTKTNVYIQRQSAKKEKKNMHVNSHFILSERSLCGSVHVHTV